MPNFLARAGGVCLSLALIIALSPGAKGQTEPAKGMPARSAPTDYQVQGHSGAFTIAVDFDGHAVPTMDGAYATEDYVVAEVAIFGEPQAKLKLSIEDFSLRINDKKAPLTSQPFGYVAKSLKDPEWQPPVQDKEKSKTSINGGGGDNGPAVVPKMPLELRRVMELKVHKSVLPEGERALPVAGLIFFPYRGKTQSIHSMELVYSGPAGNVTMALQP